MTDSDVGLDDYNLCGGTGDDKRDASTNAINLIVAGVMVLRLQDFVLGVTSHQVGIRRFLPVTWEMESGLMDCNPDCTPHRLMIVDISRRWWTTDAGA